MHFITDTTLLALCYCAMFWPTKGHLQGARLIHFHSKINKYVRHVKFSLASIVYYLT
jgi:hypothetical protein